MMSIVHPFRSHHSFLFSLYLLICLFQATPLFADNTTYYVSMSDGSDGYNGITQVTPFMTVAKVNTLKLSSGDRVLFKCGDTWQDDMLVLTDSGSKTNPILISSYPTGCTARPILSGSRPISGWVHYNGSIYRADLSTGNNGGKFNHGINQLFRNGQRLLLGRWPNINANDGGYSTVDGHNGAQAQIIDNELPPLNWDGSAIHLKGMRWYMMNRLVTETSGTTLSLNENVICHTTDCVGWGYFLNNHLNALDQEGEWYYDEETKYVYLYSATLPGTNEVEGSSIQTGSGNYLGGIILGNNLYEKISDVTIKNLDIRNWFASGITTAINFEFAEPERITIQGNIITNVDEAGIRLATWIWNAGSSSGWRGGKTLNISYNTIHGANHYGIDSYSSSSLFIGNNIQNIGMIANLNKSGMGCGFSGTNCTENGAGIRINVDKSAFSGNGNTVKNNRIDRVAMQGIDIFGPNNAIINNHISYACYAKGDCGGIRTYGGPDFASTKAENISIIGNIITDTIGNTDGNQSSFDPLFGFGLYIDNWSDDLTITDNTILNSTASGLLLQNSNARLERNTLYNNGTGVSYYGQISISGSGRSSISHCTMYAIGPNQSTLRTADFSNLTSSNSNLFFNPYRADNIRFDPGWQNFTLAQWQASSGMDHGSRKNWFSLTPGNFPKSKVFLNTSSSWQNITLGSRSYFDLVGNGVSGNLYLPPYSSKILIKDKGGAVSPYLMLLLKPATP
jgi:hypothetical protein